MKYSMKQTVAFGIGAQQGAWPVQEDGFFVDPQARVFALADGFGGRGSGDIAAKLALKEAGRRISGADAKAGAGFQRNLLVDINKNLLEWNGKRQPNTRGGCSLALLQISESGLVTAINCGGTSVGLVRNGACLGLLSPQAAPRLQPGSALLPDAALGLGGDIFPESRIFKGLPGDLLFLASSGVDWESSGFQLELLAQWGVHLPGSEIASMAENLVSRVSPEWNATFLALEIP
ncbi:MAG: PP2C family protein-serine/threonine phosphatase [Bdellovibrionota bacterium]